MRTGLFFDTETTGLPNWKRQSGDKSQPHIVQLAAIMVDLDTKKILQSIDVIVKPDGWTIPQATTDIHGISTEMASEVGIPEAVVLGMFMNLYNKAPYRIAHNTTFDNRIIRIALKRYLPNLISDEEWKNRDNYFCTLMNFKKIKGGKSGHTLAEAYKYFTSKDMDNAHNAFADVMACIDVYFGIQNYQELGIAE